MNIVIVSALEAAQGMTTMVGIPDGEGTFLQEITVMSSGERWACELISPGDVGPEVGSYDVPQEAMEVLAASPGTYIFVMQTNNPNTGGVDITVISN